MKKFLINNHEVSKTDFFRKLKESCFKRANTLQCGHFSCDVMEEDSQKFKQLAAEAKKGRVVILVNEKLKFQIKECK